MNPPILVVDNAKPPLQPSLRAADFSHTGLSLRAPPANVQAEQSLLGAMLARNSVVDSLPDDLRSEHFFEVAHGRLFAAIMAEIAAGRIADAVTMMARFSDDPDLGGTSGQTYIVGLLGAMVSFNIVPDYARLIVDLARRRELILISVDLADRAHDLTEPVDRLTASAAAQIDGTAALTSDAGTDATIDEAVDRAISSVDRAVSGESIAGIPTGFRDVDAKLGGLLPDRLYVVAGRPGMGKSAIASKMALSAARAGVPTLIFSLEMSAEEQAMRVLAEAIRFPVDKLTRGEVNVEVGDRLVRARRELRGIPLYYDEAGGLTMAQIALRARAKRRKLNIGLIVVDHIHIMGHDENAGRNSNATTEIGKISRGMKALAKALKIPVVVLAQLSRGPEAREDKRPNLSDLRYSGDIEQDADVVTFVYRDEYYLPQNPPEKTRGDTEEKYVAVLQDFHARKARAAGSAELIFAKNRGGSTGIVRLKWDGPTTSFSDDISPASNVPMSEYFDERR